MKVRKFDTEKIKRIIEFADTAYDLFLLSVERQKDLDAAIKQFYIEITCFGFPKDINVNISNLVYNRYLQEKSL